MSVTTKEKLTLASKVIGAANIGIFASERLIDEAHVGIQALQAKGECFAPKAVEVLAALRQHALPAQPMCKRALAEIAETLRPLQRQARDAEQPGPAGIRPQGG